MDGDTVILSNVQSGSSAVYQCNASNEFGYLMANAFVNVLGEFRFVSSEIRIYAWLEVLLCYFTAAEAPRILTPTNQVYRVITNNPALLHCASFGSPIPVITW